MDAGLLPLAAADVSELTGGCLHLILLLLITVLRGQRDLLGLWQEPCRI